MFDQEKIDINCPNGHQVRVTIREARRSPTVTCRSCGAEIAIDATQFDRELRDVERKLREFGKQFSR